MSLVTFDKAHSHLIGKRAMPCISSFEGAVEAVTCQLYFVWTDLLHLSPSLLRFMCLPLFITPSATPFKVSLFFLAGILLLCHGGRFNIQTVMDAHGFCRTTGNIPL